MEILNRISRGLSKDDGSEVIEGILDGIIDGVLETVAHREQSTKAVHKLDQNGLILALHVLNDQTSFDFTRIRGSSTAEIVLGMQYKSHLKNLPIENICIW